MPFGDVSTHMMAKTPVKERWRELKNALYNRQVIPLVGAGVSAGRVDIAENLVKKLNGLVKTEVFGSPGRECSLARIADLAIRKHGHAEVCAALEIASWADKAPTRAHRYLAMLAADGFIDEIITTNYDCGIEHAWRALGRTDGLHVVRDASELHVARPRWGRTDLRLYKINGCADLLKRAASSGKDEEKKEDAASRILLTDTQLQGFHRGEDRRWVADLLRDRARSHTLVLSGFASDEPQVCQAVRLILDELEALRRRGCGEETKPGSGCPPRLWIVLYGDTLPFHLLQAVLDEALLRGHKPLSSSSDRFDNVFSGDDRPHFRCCGTPGLDAGVFWRRAWLEVLQDSLADARGPVACAFVRAVLGKVPRPERPEDHGIFTVWKSVVVDTFPGLPLDEPVDDGGSATWDGDVMPPGSPGVSWAERYYITAHEAPKHWVVVVLVVLAGCQVESRYEDDGPRLVVPKGAFKISIPASAGHVQVRVELNKTGRVDKEDRRVEMCVGAELLGHLRGFDGDHAALKSRMEHYLMYENPLHQARKREHDGRRERRMES